MVMVRVEGRKKETRREQRRQNMVESDDFDVAVWMENLRMRRGPPANGF